MVHLDVGQATRRPFGLNLLDVGLGWGRDQLVENALRVFKHEFDRFWGPRMELVFRMALVLLVDANQRLVAADPSGGEVASTPSSRCRAYSRTTCSAGNSC